MTGKGSRKLRRDREKRQFIELLFGQNYNRIYEYCYLKLGPPPQDAEDCAMEVFIRALNHADTLMEHPCPERWLYVTARNVSLEFIRKQSKGRKWEILDGGELLAAASGREESIEESFLAAEKKKTEDEATAEQIIYGCLKPREQELYRLLVTEKKNTMQIADALSISYTNATTRIYRLRRKVKKQLECRERRENKNEAR